MRLTAPIAFNDSQRHLPPELDFVDVFLLSRPARGYTETLTLVSENADPVYKLWYKADGVWHSWLTVVGLGGTASASWVYDLPHDLFAEIYMTGNSVDPCRTYQLSYTAQAPAVWRLYLPLISN